MMGRVTKRCGAVDFANDLTSFMPGSMSMTFLRNGKLLCSPLSPRGSLVDQKVASCFFRVNSFKAPRPDGLNGQGS